MYVFPPVLLFKDLAGLYSLLLALFIRLFCNFFLGKRALHLFIGSPRPSVVSQNCSPPPHLRDAHHLTIRSEDIAVENILLKTHRSHRSRSTKLFSTFWDKSCIFFSLADFQRDVKNRGQAIPDNSILLKKILIFAAVFFPRHIRTDSPGECGTSWCNVIVRWLRFEHRTNGCTHLRLGVIYFIHIHRYKNLSSQVVCQALKFFLTLIGTFFTEQSISSFFANINRKWNQPDRRYTRKNVGIKKEKSPWEWRKYGLRHPGWVQTVGHGALTGPQCCRQSGHTNNQRKWRNIVRKTQCNDVLRFCLAQKIKLYNWLSEEFISVEIFAVFIIFDKSLT